MATIINNPGNQPSNNGESTGVGMIVGIILAIGVIGLFFVYALPMIRESMAPADTTGGPEINITLPTIDPVTPTPENNPQ